MMKKIALTPRCFKKRRRVNDTAKFFFVYTNISAKLKTYAKILQHINNGPRWDRVIKINCGQKSHEL